MSRLDRHIATIQGKLAFRLFLNALAWSAILLFAAALLDILIDRFFSVGIPRPWFSVLIGGIVAIGVSIAWAIYRRPDQLRAAVAIDQELGLKEKFSTALYARPLADPFARAAVADAERSADNVSLHRRFGPQYPRQANGAIVLCGATLLSAWLIPSMDLFRHSQQQQSLLALAQQQQQQEQVVKRELALMAPLTRPSVAPDAVKLAREAQDLLAHPDNDSARTNAAVATKMADAADILKKVADTQAQYRQARENEELLKNMESTKDDDNSPMSKLQNEIKKQDFDAAASDLNKAVQQFDKMTPEQQKAAIQQAKTLAAALSKAASNPATQQQINNQLRQMTGNPQLAQKMASALAAAAQGNPQAAQQLQQMAQKAMSQMNNGQGPTAQQRQMVQQMMAGIQAKAGSQAQTQAMAQAAQQMAQAMAQSNNAQQGINQKPANQQQGVAAAKQNLQQQLQQMQNAQQDAQAMAAAQQAAQQAADAAANGQQQGNNPGQGQGKNPGQGQQANNNPGQGQGGQQPGQNHGQGQGGQQPMANGQPQPGNGGQPQPPNPQGGQGNNGQTAGYAPREVSEAPAEFEKQYDPTQDNGKGHMLASRFIHADIDPGAMKAELKNIAVGEQQDDSQDMDQDQIPQESQKAVRDYYDKLQQQ